MTSLPSRSVRNDRRSVANVKRQEVLSPGSTREPEPKAESRVRYTYTMPSASQLPPGTRIFSLSTHAHYACAHSGACCTAGWPIPVERETYQRLRASIEAGHLNIERRTVGADPLANAQHGVADRLFVRPDTASAETPALACISDDVCVFYERDRRRCAIHRQLGPAFLPVACQQFPRVSMLDGRGLFVNVSHYCPTAAALLFEDVDVAVVESPPAFGQDFNYDPLDARGALPPLLTPSVLMDLKAYDEWERAVVALFAHGELTAEQALSAAIAFTEEVRRWTPRDGGETLRERIRDSVPDGLGTCAAALQARESAGLKTTRRRRPSSLVRGSWLKRGTSDQRPATRNQEPGTRDEEPGARAEDDKAHYALVLDCVPAAFRPPVSLDGLDAAYADWVAPAWQSFRAPLKRYLAAKVFGTWLSYQGRGIRATMFSAVVALSLVRVHAALTCAAASRALDRALLTEAVRRSDELLLHLASREELARRLSGVEDGGDLRGIAPAPASDIP